MQAQHPKKTKPRHHDLDALAGTWTRDEATVFEKLLAEQRKIDPLKTLTFKKRPK
ncbi:MAG: hypothetical protein AB1515_07215 [Nitrospirota bacterium]